MDLNCPGPLTCRFFFNKYIVSLCILGFYICRFDPTWIKKSIFDSHLGICVFGGPTKLHANFQMGREGGGDSAYPKTVMGMPGAENKKRTEEIFEEKK